MGVSATQLGRPGQAGQLLAECYTHPPWGSVMIVPDAQQAIPGIVPDLIDCIFSVGIAGVQPLARMMLYDYNTSSTRAKTLPPRKEMPPEISQIIRSKRKTLALIVQPDGSLIVRAPARASATWIREFVEKKREWIEKHQARALAIPARGAGQYLPGEMFLYLGRAYPLEIVEGQQQPLLLEQAFRLAASHHSAAAPAFERWYRERARPVLTERVELFARQHNFHYKAIRITSARTRWGSCSVSGSLSFSWRLILAPLPVVDYVVVHELAHTVVHNHSQQFWHTVGTILPAYREQRQWLREHGREILTRT